jgi:pyruvate/2-oxoglutarate dehydrogenase complex dihydrolipoamide acyltransferase (E2) component
MAVSPQRGFAAEQHIAQQELEAQAGTQRLPRRVLDLPLHRRPRHWHRPAFRWRQEDQFRARHPRRRSSPAARRFAELHGIDPSGITGSGPAGAITYADVERHIGENHRSIGPPWAITAVYVE